MGLHRGSHDEESTLELQTQVSRPGFGVAVFLGFGVWGLGFGVLEGLLFEAVKPQKSSKGRFSFAMISQRVLGCSPLY